MDYVALQKIIGHKIKESALIVFSPLNENSLENVDISINLSFNTNLNLTLTTDRNLWTSIIKQEKILNKRPFKEFYDYLDYWMNSDNENANLKYDFFDLTDSSEFKFIFESPIISVHLLNIITDNKNLNPHGILISFENGLSICSRTGTDGTMIQCHSFLPNPSYLTCFSWIGETKLINVKMLL